MRADGNCFYRGISYESYGHRDNHYHVRQKTWDVIEDHQAVYQHLATESNQSWSRFVKRGRRNGIYADNHDVLACSERII